MAIGFAELEGPEGPQGRLVGLLGSSLSDRRRLRTGLKKKGKGGLVFGEYVLDVQKGSLDGYQVVERDRVHHPQGCTGYPILDHDFH